MLLGSWTQQEILWKIPWFKAYAFSSTSAFFPSIFVHALFFMFYVMFAVCAFCAWFPDSLIVFFVWACSSCALFLPFYLWCVCVSYWKNEWQKVSRYIWGPPPFPAICMIHTWCILKYLSFYLHIPVSLSLSISLVLDSCIPLPIYLLPSIYGSIYSISRSIYHILAQISIMI